MKEMKMANDRIKGGLKEVAGQVEAVTGEVMDDGEMVTRGRGRQAAGNAQGMYGQAKGAIRNGAYALDGLAESVIDESEDYLQDASRALTSEIQRNPIGAVAIAAAAGLVAGLLMRR